MALVIGGGGRRREWDRLAEARTAPSQRGRLNTRDASPARALQNSPGREPWEQGTNEIRTLQGWRRSLFRPYRALLQNLINRPGAHAPGCSARPPSGPISSNHARCVVFETISARRTHAAVAETSDLLPPITDGTPALLSLAKQGQTGSSGQNSNSKQPVRPALARHFERPPATAVRISFWNKPAAARCLSG